MNACIRTALLVGCAVCAAYGQDIMLSGSVVDPLGQGVEDARVTLLGQQLSVYTDADGAFEIVQSGVSRATSRPITDSPSISGSVLRYHSLASGRPLRVTVHALTGRTVWNATGLSSSGPGTFPLPRLLGDGLYLVRVSVSGRTWTLSWCPGHRTGLNGGPTAPGGGLTKRGAGAVDTLEVVTDGFLTRYVGVTSYDQYVTVYLSSGGDMSLSLNDGDVYTVVDTCTVVLRDRSASARGVRFTDSTCNGVPVFGAGNARNPSDSAVVSDSVYTQRWALRLGRGRKCVWAEVTSADSTVDTLYDCIDIAPYTLRVTMQNPTSGSETSRRYSTRLEKVELGNRYVEVQNIYRPYYQFSINTGGDSSFVPRFSCAVGFAEGDEPKVRGYPLLRTVQRTFSLDGDSGHVYEYSFDPDTADGRANLDSLYRDIVPGFGRLYGLSSRGVYNVPTSLSRTDMYLAGRKEIVLVLSFTGKYFGERRNVLVSGRIDERFDFVTYFDAYPPVIHRDWWQHDMPEEGDTVSGVIRVSMHTGDQYDTASQDRGFIADFGEADVAGVDLVLARMPDSMAAAWNDSSYRGITMEDVFRLPMHTWPLPIPEPKPVIRAMTWDSVDLRQVVEGSYLAAFVTEDSFGNRGLGYLQVGNVGGYVEWGVHTNPMRWYVMSNYHEY